MRRSVVLAALLLVARPCSAAGNKSCTHDDVFDDATGVFDLSGCRIVKIENVDVDAGALAKALNATGNGMKMLEVTGASIDPLGAMQIADEVASHATLRVIVLDNNPLYAQGADMIARAVLKNELILRLSLSNTRIGDDGAKIFGLLLQHNSALLELELRDNGILPPGVAAIAGALQSNQRLRTLDLSGNPLFRDGARELVRGMKGNSHLRHLNLRGTRLQDSGAVELANALKGDQVGLQDLDLWGNEIGDEGADALAHAFKTNTQLQVLNLWQNEVTDRGVASFCEGLVLNTALHELHLGRNTGITDEGAYSLAGLLRANSGLYFVDFGSGHTGVTEPYSQPIAQAASCNRMYTDNMHERFACKTKVLAKVPIRLHLAHIREKMGFNVEEEKKAFLLKQERLKEIRASLSKEQLEELDDVTKQALDEFEKEVEKDERFQVWNKGKKVDVEGENDDKFVQPR